MTRNNVPSESSECLVIFLEYTRNIGNIVEVEILHKSFKNLVYLNVNEDMY